MGTHYDVHTSVTDRFEQLLTSYPSPLFFQARFLSYSELSQTLFYSLPVPFHLCLLALLHSASQPNRFLSSSCTFIHVQLYTVFLCVFLSVLSFFSVTPNSSGSFSLLNTPVYNMKASVLFASTAFVASVAAGSSGHATHQRRHAPALKRAELNKRRMAPEFAGPTLVRRKDPMTDQDTTT